MALLLMVAIAIGCVSSTQSRDICVGQTFVCSQSHRANKGGKCGLTDLSGLKALVGQPSSVCTLDLSNGNITNIPAGVFKGFTSLVNLTLSDNQLQSWDTQGLQNELPALQYLDLTNNHHWIPDDGLLSIRNLMEIRGVRWNNQCSDCSLKRDINKTLLDKIKKKEYFEWVQGYACRAKISKYSLTLQLFAKHGFVPECFTKGSSCYNNEVTERSEAPCRDVNIRVLALEYLFGPIAIVLNLVVVVTTACSERLRRNIAMVLVSNLAFGDLLNGIYSVIIAAVHHAYDYKDTRKFADTKCNFIGPMWLIGQTIAVSCSLVLTYERYRSVVNSVKVKSRMKMKTARIAILCCWVGSLIAAFLPFVGVGMYSIGTFCIPIYPVKSIPHQFWYSLIVTLVACLMYLATLPLYVRLYLYVKKSSSRIGSTTDVALAKRIFVLVISNMFFFLLPIAISLAWSILSRKQVMSRVVAEVLTSSFCVICLTVNSCLNPVLYALRNKTFIKELKKMLFKKFGKCCGGICAIDNGYSIDKTSKSGSSRASNYHVQKTTV